MNKKQKQVLLNAIKKEVKETVKVAIKEMQVKLEGYYNEVAEAALNAALEAAAKSIKPVKPVNVVKATTFKKESRDNTGSKASKTSKASKASMEPVAPSKGKETVVVNEEAPATQQGSEASEASIEEAVETKVTETVQATETESEETAAVTSKETPTVTEESQPVINEEKEEVQTEVPTEEDEDDDIEAYLQEHQKEIQASTGVVGMSNMSDMLKQVLEMDIAGAMKEQPEEDAKEEAIYQKDLAELNALLAEEGVDGIINEIEAETKTTSAPVAVPATETTPTSAPAPAPEKKVATEKKVRKGYITEEAMKQVKASKSSGSTLVVEDLGLETIKAPYAAKEVCYEVEGKHIVLEKKNMFIKNIEDFDLRRKTFDFNNKMALGNPNNNNSEEMQAKGRFITQFIREYAMEIAAFNNIERIEGDAGAAMLVAKVAMGHLQSPVLQPRNQQEEDAVKKLIIDMEEDVNRKHTIVNAVKKQQNFFPIYPNRSVYMEHVGLSKEELLLMSYALIYARIALTQQRTAKGKATCVFPVSERSTIA